MDTYETQESVKTFDEIACFVTIPFDLAQDVPITARRDDGFDTGCFDSRETWHTADQISTCSMSVFS